MQIPRMHLDETPSSFESLFRQIGFEPKAAPAKKARSSPAAQRRRSTSLLCSPPVPKAVSWVQPQSLSKLQLDTAALLHVLQTGAEGIRVKECSIYLTSRLTAIICTSVLHVNNLLRSTDDSTAFLRTVYPQLPSNYKLNFRPQRARRSVSNLKCRLLVGAPLGTKGWNSHIRTSHGLFLLQSTFQRMSYR